MSCFPGLLQGKVVSNIGHIMRWSTVTLLCESWIACITDARAVGIVALGGKSWQGFEHVSRSGWRGYGGTDPKLFTN